MRHGSNGTILTCSIRVDTDTMAAVISGSGVLVRVKFAEEAQATEFAEAFAGFTSTERPSIEHREAWMTNEPSEERSSREA
jgi:hypothetical protein